MPRFKWVRAPRRVEVAPGGAEIRISGATSIPIEFAGELVGGIVAVALAAAAKAS